MKNLRWGLSLKLLLLLAIPVIFQIAIFVYLLQLQAAQENILQRLTKPLAVNAELSLALNDFIKLFATAEREQKTFLGSSEFHSIRKEGLTSLSHLQALLVGLPEKSIIDGTLSKIRELDVLIDDIRAAALTGSTGFGIQTDGRLPLVEEKYNRLIEKTGELATIVHSMDHTANALIVEWERNEQEYSQALEAGLLAEFSLSAIGLFWVMSSLRRRAGVLIDNSYRLASGVELNAPVGGDDEIAVFDAEFHKAARTLAEAEQFEKIITENAGAVICAVNEKLSFAGVRGGSAELFGYSPGTLSQMKVGEVILPDDIAQLNRHFDSAKLRGTADFESRCWRRDGTVVPTAWSASWNADTQLFFCTILDNTERKRAERARLEVLRMLSEDLQAPISTVNNTLNQLLAGSLGKLSDKGENMVPKALSSTSQMLTLIKDLVDIESIEAGGVQLNFGQYQLADIVKQSAHLVDGLSAKHKVSIVIDTANDITINVDKERMIQILSNLLSNAIKFSPSGSAVIVSTSCSHEGTEIKIMDRGRGISADILPTIFERFRQADLDDAREKGGTGLGLAICKALVDLHHGKIRAESSGNTGTTLTIWLPARSNP